MSSPTPLSEPEIIVELRFNRPARKLELKLSSSLKYAKYIYFAYVRLDFRVLAGLVDEKGISFGLCAPLFWFTRLICK